VRQRQIPAQTANVTSDNFGDCAQFLKGRIALASFHPTDITRRGIRLQREILLGQPFGFARLSNPFTQELERGWFSQPLKRRWNNDFTSSHYSDDLCLRSLLLKSKICLFKFTKRGFDLIGSRKFRSKPTYAPPQIPGKGCH
jgi:hypothetical protein